MVTGSDSVKREKTEVKPAYHGCDSKTAVSCQSKVLDVPSMWHTALLWDIRWQKTVSREAITK